MAKSIFCTHRVHIFKKSLYERKFLSYKQNFIQVGLSFHSSLNRLPPFFCSSFYFNISRKRSWFYVPQNLFSWLIYQLKTPIKKKDTVTRFLTLGLFSSISPTYRSLITWLNHFAYVVWFSPSQDIQETKWIWVQMHVWCYLMPASAQCMHFSYAINYLGLINLLIYLKLKTMNKI
jgi:hypothetical protein